MQQKHKKIALHRFLECMINAFRLIKYSMV